MSNLNTEVKSLLLSNVTGVGETASIAESYQYITETEISVNGIVYPISDTVQRAKLLQLLDKESKNKTDTQKAEAFQALAEGYLGVFHKKASLSGNSKPAIAGKATMTSTQYLSNCVKGNVDTSAVVQFYYDAIGLPAKATTKDLQTVIDSLLDILQPNDEQTEHYNYMLAEERKYSELFTALAGIGCTNVSHNVSKDNILIIVCSVSPDKLVPLSAYIAENGYTLSTDTKFTDGLLQVSFSRPE